MEFNSQICTSVEQSKRLLELGLKKETADMVWMKELAWDEVNHCTYDAEAYMLRPIDYLEGESHRGHIPAWSLHRLMEILPFEPHLKDFNTEFQYDAMLVHIANAIGQGLINPEYLEEQQ